MTHYSFKLISTLIGIYPANMRRRLNVGLMLARRLRCQTTLNQHRVNVSCSFVGIIKLIYSIQDNQCFCKVITMK